VNEIKIRASPYSQVNMVCGLKNKIQSKKFKADNINKEEIPDRETNKLGKRYSEPPI
jgi:hypothetical protein